MIHISPCSKLFSLLTLIWMLSVLQGCSSPVESAIKGNWVIEPGSFIWNGMDVFDCIGPNVVVFLKDGSCSFPGSLMNCGPLSASHRPKLRWQLRENGSHHYTLALSEAAAYIPKEMHIWFSKDVPGKWFILHVESESLSFHCKKNQFDFDGNQKLIDKAIYLTTGKEPGHD